MNKIHGKSRNDFIPQNFPFIRYKPQPIGPTNYYKLKEELGILLSLGVNNISVMFLT